MKNSTLIPILLSSIFALSACSSPPEPVEFPHNTTGENANTFIHRLDTNKVASNRFDDLKWSYSLINHGSTLSQANVAKFWYLAHHADKITLYGEQKNIDDLRLYIVAKGATKDVQLIPNCYHTRAAPCSKIVSILFEKDQTKSSTNPLIK